VKAAQEAIAAQLPPVMAALGTDLPTANKVIASVAGSRVVDKTKLN
jgi:hypothetical protein